MTSRCSGRPRPGRFSSPAGAVDGRGRGWGARRSEACISVNVTTGQAGSGAALGPLAPEDSDAAVAEGRVMQQMLPPAVRQREDTAPPATVVLLGGLHRQAQPAALALGRRTRTPGTPNITAAVGPA